MYAIIATGGKQYLVEEGQVVRVEKLVGDRGSKVVFDRVLLIGNSSEPKVGRPYLDKTSVEGEIVLQARAPKVLVFKKKKRKGFKKIFGHRQCITDVKITKISS